MSVPDFKIALCEVDRGRFEDVIHALHIDEACGKCDYFNKSVNDPRMQYRCYVSGLCIAATLHPHVVSYLNWKLGWITQEQHYVNCRI